MLGKITRRAAIGGLAAGSALPLRHAQADLASLAEAARKEGTLTWYIAQMSGEAAEDMGRTFTRRYPGISVTVIRTTGQVAYQRVLQELKNSTPQCDVFCSTDISHYPALKARNALAQYHAGKCRGAGAAVPRLGDPAISTPDDRLAAGHGLQHQEREAGGRAEELDRPARPEMEGPRRRRPSGVQRLFRHLGAGDAQTLWLGVLREAGEEQPAHRPLGQRPDHLLNAGECLVGTGPVSTSVQNVERAIRLASSTRRDGTLLCFGPSAVLAPRRIPMPLACSWSGC